MAYQTGTSANPDQLLDALRVFAVANGWTQLRWAPDGTGQTLSLTKGGHYVHLRSAVNEGFLGHRAITGIHLTGSTGLDANKSWFDQPGSIVSVREGHAACCGLYEMSAANTYHLFYVATPELIMCVAEVSPGVYHHLAFGEIIKFGSYGGGLFVSGPFNVDYYDNRHFGLPLYDTSNNGTSYILADVDGVTDWYSISQNYPFTGKRAKSLWERGEDSQSLAYNWWKCVPNTLNGVTPMLPFYLFVERPNGYFSPFGYTAHMRYLNITNYAPAEVFTLGTEQWMVFPAHSKNGISGVHGYAVRYIP